MALLVAFICKQTPERGEGFNLAVDIVVAAIGVIPVSTGLFEVWQSKRLRKKQLVTEKQAKKKKKTTKGDRSRDIEFGGLESPVGKDGPMGCCPLRRKE